MRLTLGWHRMALLRVRKVQTYASTFQPTTWPYYASRICKHFIHEIHPRKSVLRCLKNIIWPNDVNPVSPCHIASLGHNESKWTSNFDMDRNTRLMIGLDSFIHIQSLSKWNYPIYIYIYIYIYIQDIYHMIRSCRAWNSSVSLTSPVCI